MALHNELGAEGEALAASYLEKQGYQIKARNFRFGKDEIDIIAQHNNELIIIEVKSRNGTYFEAPEKAVTIAKQKRLVRAANHYVIKNDIDLESRFDIIAITFIKKHPHINHIINAFSALH